MVNVLGHQSDFTSGEVAERFSGSTTNPIRETGLSTLENSVITRSGSIKKRGGTHYVCSLPSGEFVGQATFDTTLILLHGNFFLIKDLDSSPGTDSTTDLDFTTLAAGTGAGIQILFPENDSIFLPAQG